MGYCNNDSGKRIQIIFQDRKCRDIDIVRDLVKKKDVRCRSQDFKEIETLLLYTGKLLDRRIKQSRVK